MSQRRSRVQKFAELREEIMSDHNERIETKELSHYANQLHRLDDEQFDNMEVSSNEHHQPLHLRRETFDVNSVDEFIEEPQVDNEKLDSLYQTASSTMIEDTDSFRSDYLADFISEAKQYNVEKGFRSDYDTKSNLLRELKAQQIYREDEIEEFDEVFSEEDDQIIETQEIIEEPVTVDPVEIEELEFEEPEYEEEIEETIQFQTPDYIEEDVVEEDPFEETIMMQVAKLANQEMNDEDFYDFQSDDIMEATTQLKIQLDQQNEVVKDMGQRIDKTSRSMNVLLTVLIIFLLILIGAFAYILLKLYGIV